jgi:transposase InsO family protein
MLEDAVAWFGGSVESQRLDFCRLVESGSGVTFSELCARFGISRSTGYKGLNRYLADGPGALRDRSRVPHLSPTRTSVEVEERVLEVREKHPAWGGRKIRRRLIDLGKRDVPAAATITGILYRHNKIAAAEPQAGGYTSFEADEPNDMWQMDFKGWFTCGTGRCDPFDVLDDHSRYNLHLEACTDQKTGTVKMSLTDTFTTYGIPKWILCRNPCEGRLVTPRSRLSGHHFGSVHVGSLRYRP